jgi:hypothetical protein
MPWHPPDQSFQLEHAQRGHDLAGGHAGAGDQVVDRGWPVVEMAQQRSFRVGECQLGRVTDRWFLGIGANFLNQGIPMASTNCGPSNNNIRQTPDVKSDPEIGFDRTALTRLHNAQFAVRWIVS